VAAVLRRGHSRRRERTPWWPPSRVAVGRRASMWPAWGRLPEGDPRWRHPVPRPRLHPRPRCCSRWESRTLSAPRGACAGGWSKVFLGECAIWAGTRPLDCCPTRGDCLQLVSGAIWRSLHRGDLSWINFCGFGGFFGLNMSVWHGCWTFSLYCTWTCGYMDDLWLLLAVGSRCLS